MAFLRGLVGTLEACDAAPDGTRLPLTVTSRAATPPT